MEQTRAVSSSCRHACAYHLGLTRKRTYHVSARQYTSMHISARQCTSVHVSARQCTSVHVSARQCTAVHGSARQCTHGASMHISARQCTSVHVSARQCTSVHGSARQCTAVHPWRRFAHKIAHIINDQRVTAHMRQTHHHTQSPSLLITASYVHTLHRTSLYPTRPCMTHRTGNRAC